MLNRRLRYLLLVIELKIHVVYVKLSLSNYFLMKSKEVIAKRESNCYVKVWIAMPTEKQQEYIRVKLRCRFECFNICCWR